MSENDRTIFLRFVQISITETLADPLVLRMVPSEILRAAYERIQKRLILKQAIAEEIAAPFVEAPALIKLRKTKIAYPTFMHFIHTLECVATVGPHARRIEAHHAGVRGLRQKADDSTVIPLCTAHHTHQGGPYSIHRLGKKFWLTHNLNRDEVIAQGQELYRLEIMRLELAAPERSPCIVCESTGWAPQLFNDEPRRCPRGCALALLCAAPDADASEVPL